MIYTLKTRSEALKKAMAQFPNLLSKIAKESTMRAVEKAQDLTPPTKNTLRGANTITGELKQSWATASKTQPTKKGRAYVTTLANDKEYASYVNDGHRMDRHFVPGLVIDSNGLLSRNLDGKGGIVVGTQTAYVKGLFMTEAALKTYKDTVRKETEKIKREFE